MATTVHIWGALDLTGHASVQTAQKYFSFHPLDPHRKVKSDIVSSSPARLTDLDEDFRPGFRPVKSVVIDWLDENAIYQRMLGIAEGMDRGTVKYSLLTTNCSLFSADLLFAGAGVQFDTHKTMQELWSEVKRVPFRHDHGRVTELIREFVEDAVFICTRRGRIGRSAGVIASILVAADFASRMFCWTPGDVLCLARNLAEKNHRPVAYSR